MRTILNYLLVGIGLAFGWCLGLHLIERLF